MQKSLTSCLILTLLITIPISNIYILYFNVLSKSKMANTQYLSMKNLTENLAKFIVKE